MKQELSDKSISHICMYMRVIDLMKNNPEILNENSEMKLEFEKVCGLVNQMMELLTEEQRDIVLEEHKRQIGEIRRNQQNV